MANTTILNAVTNNNVTSTPHAASGNVMFHCKMSKPGKLIIFESSPDNTNWFHLKTVSKTQSVSGGDLGQNTVYFRVTPTNNEDGAEVTVIMTDES